MAGRVTFEGLNHEQYEFVYANDRVILALAGPGSGKTRSLTFRVARLVKEGVFPERIMLTTFTKMAAEEMRERVGALLNMPLTNMQAGTFHSFGAKFLRKYYRYAHLDSDYRILNEKDARSLISDLKKTTPFLKNHDSRTREYFTDERTFSLISLQRNTNKSYYELLLKLYPVHIDVAEDFEMLASEYRKLKAVMNVCDFDDLLLLWLEILRNNSNVLEEARNEFDHILVDEYQDTNVIQAEIIDLIATKASLAVVGDIDQSIYRFRGAEVYNMIDFPKRYPETRIIQLAENYRSSPEILRVANCLIKHNKDRFDMTLRTSNLPTQKPIWYEHEDPVSEAQWLGKRLMTHHLTSNETLAVLFRSSYLVSLLELELVRNKVPYRILGGKSILQRSHINDALCWLRVFADAMDAFAWRRVLYFFKGVPDEHYVELWNQIRDSKDPLLDILSGIIQSPDRDKSWNKMRNTLGRLIVTGNKPGKMLRALLTEDYIAELERRYNDPEERAMDIERLADFGERFHSLWEFLRALDEAKKEQKEDSDAKITLTTMHSSKGREYDCVYILGCNEKIIPSPKATEPEDINEERRLFYVAITRARKYLYFSSCRTMQRASGKIELEPSRFMEEMGRENYVLECL